MELFSNSEAENILKSADTEKAQSFLLEGQEGCGKKELAMKFACDLLGNETRVLGGSHPDFLLVERRTDEKTGKRKKEIIAEDARKISSFLSLTPAEGAHRICIVDSADVLNISAANSILKILEEPPKRAIIILLSHGGHLLATIRSRCVAIRFQPASHDEMLSSFSENMPDISDEDKQLLMLISNNSLGLAQRIYDGDGLNVSRETLQFFSEFPRFDQKKASKFVADIAKSEGKWDIFKTTLAWLVTNIAKQTAKGYELEIEGLKLNNKLNDFEGLLDAERKFTEEVKSAEVFNLDKKQTLIDILRRFSACYA